MWDKLNKTREPGSLDFSEYVRNPLWDEFVEYITAQYQVRPKYEYSRCSLPGWNVKFKKAGKNLCTLYPYEGYFVVMVVIGKHEKERFEEELPLFTPYMRELYDGTDDGMGQRWLQIVFEDRDRFEDVKRCIAIRRG